jgi:hypothetical protein
VPYVLALSGVFHFIINIFNGFLAILRGFNPFLGDLGPFLRSYLGGKLGDGYQLQAYINKRLFNPWEGVQNNFMLPNF